MQIPPIVVMVPVPLVATQDEIAAAFTEWERRFREEPQRFATDSQRLADSPETYGEACAPYFLEILKELPGRG